MRSDMEEHEDRKPRSTFVIYAVMALAFVGCVGLLIGLYELLERL